jgi:nudix-type nucleoside diphosphatase (YffH/AdpP family)
MSAEIIESKEIYAGFIRLLQTTLRLDDHKRQSREIIVHGRAAAVLPYDPERRVVMLVKLLRAPILFATGAQDHIEAPAGMVDSGSPDETAKREALEETGLRLITLEHVGSAWSSPGISTEKIELYLAPYAKGDRVSAGGGERGREHHGRGDADLRILGKPGASGDFRSEDANPCPGASLEASRLVLTQGFGWWETHDDLCLSARLISHIRAANA